MIKNNSNDLFYSAESSGIWNFLFGITMLYGIRWLPDKNIKMYDPIALIISASMFIFVGILPVLSYNLIRFRMVKLGELNYGMWRYVLSTLPFIVPMLIYYIAWLRGFRMKI